MVTWARAVNSCSNEQGQSETRRGEGWLLQGGLQNSHAGLDLVIRIPQDRQESACGSAEAKEHGRWKKEGWKKGQWKTVGRQTGMGTNRKPVPLRLLGWGWGAIDEDRQLSESPVKEEESKHPKEKWVGGRNSLLEGKNCSYLGHFW